MITIKILQARDRAGISLRALERISGIPKTTLHRIENGIKSPTLDELERIARAIGCRMSDLYDSPLR